ncbi:hypothetical protein OCE25_26105 [Bacillus cereus]|nr:hypothetical protein [Bacillus cereus]
MNYELKTINPTKEIFSFRLDTYDCYELRSGICSLYLSESEAASIHKQERITGESDVLYCRDLAKNLYQKKYFENIMFQNNAYSIRMHHQDCGHFDFTDGQHRTCIAKHLNIQTLYANVESSDNAYVSSCDACRCKQKIEVENKKLVNKVFKLFGLNRGTKLPSEILDIEYMNFKDDFHLINFITELKR